MTSTKKRIHVALTKENLRQLESLMSHFGESRSEVMKRALTGLHLETSIYNNDYIPFKEEDYK